MPDEQNRTQNQTGSERQKQTSMAIQVMKAKKLYVHTESKMNGDGHANGKIKSETPSPNEIVGGKTRPEIKRQKAIKSGNKLAAICRIRSQTFAASCRLLSLALAAIGRSA